MFDSLSTTIGEKISKSPVQLNPYVRRRPVFFLQWLPSLYFRKMEIKKKLLLPQFKISKHETFSMGLLVLKLQDHCFFQISREKLP